MIDLHQQILTHVETFLARVAASARQAAMESLAAALGAKPGGRSATRGQLPARSAGTAAPAAAAPVSSPRPRPRLKKGGKRAPDQLVALVDELRTYISANPGQRIEQINAALGCKSGELALPVRKLLGARAIRTTGAKRATRYYPRGGSRGARAKPRAAGKTAAAKKRGKKK